MDWQGTNVVITGAGSGIGKALAEDLASRGARLALVDLSRENLDAVAQTLPDPNSVHLADMDVSNQSHVQALAEALVAKDFVPDVVINNAGINLSSKAMGTSLEELTRVMDINFYGMVHGIQAFLPGMQARGSGTMVVVSSIFGIVGMPTQTAYNASKFAIRGYAEALREEVAADGIKVLVVCPGGVRTNIMRNAQVKDLPIGLRPGSDPIKAFDKIAKTSPEQAAEQIRKAIERGDNRVLIGKDARMMDRLQRLFPGGYHKIMRKLGANI